MATKCDEHNVVFVRPLCTLWLNQKETITANILRRKKIQINAYMLPIHASGGTSCTYAPMRCNNYYWGL